MQPLRFDGSTDWVAPARAVETVVLRSPGDSAPLIERTALTLLGLLAGLVLLLSFAAHAV